MRVESLVTCLHVGEFRDSRSEEVLPTLIGVFQRLAYMPQEFAVYCSLRPGVEDESELQLRCRKGRLLWFESDVRVIQFGEMPARHAVLWVYDTVAPPGRSVVELIAGGSVASSCVVDFVP